MIINTDDTISRQAAIDALADMHCKSDEDGYVWIIRSDAWARIDALPTADVRENVRGEWAMDGNFCGMNHYRCSVCERQEFRQSSFCPNCGADMRSQDV